MNAFVVVNSSSSTFDGDGDGDAVWLLFVDDEVDFVDLVGVVDDDDDNDF